MDWLVKLFTTPDSVAHIALLYAVVIAVGVYLGKIKIGGVSLGVTFVLFVGILAGHVGFTGPVPVLTFLQDFGLILFVFMIGLQVGPGFFESFGKGGIKLDMLSTITVVLNVLVMFACYYIFFDTKDPNNLPMMVGTLYGAVTNTPGLGAANEALQSVFTNGNPPSIANGYACAYPLGVLGIIGTTLLIKVLTRSNFDEENAKLTAAEKGNPAEMPYKMYLRVQNAHICGRNLKEISEFLNRDIVASRMVHDGKMCVPNRDTVFELGDEVLIVCAQTDAEAIKAFIGTEIDGEWMDSERKLNAPNLGTIFIGIMVGLIFGSLPVAIPGMPVPLKLGLAGGPLIIAILIGRWGTRFHLITYMTTSANLMLREFGLALFLASVGIKAGAGFWETVVAGDGLKYDVPPHPGGPGGRPILLRSVEDELINTVITPWWGMECVPSPIIFFLWKDPMVCAHCA